MKPIEKKAEALRDLDEAFIYLAENGGLPLADRFLEAAERVSAC